MKDSTCSKTWEKTRVRHHIRHKSGRCQARLFLNGKDGKEIWNSFKTGHLIAAGQLLPVEHQLHVGDFAGARVLIEFEPELEDRVRRHIE